MSDSGLVDIYLVTHKLSNLFYFRAITAGRDVTRQLILKPLKSILKGTTPKEWDAGRLARTQALLTEVRAHRPEPRERWRPEWEVVGEYSSVTLKEGVDLALEYARRHGLECINIAHMPPLKPEDSPQEVFK